MAKRFVTSYQGRTVAEVSLQNVPAEKRSIRGSTLFLRPKTTNVLTEDEISEIEKEDPVAFKGVVVHREIKAEKKKKKVPVEEKPVVDPVEEKPVVDPKPPKKPGSSGPKKSGKKPSSG